MIEVLTWIWMNISWRDLITIQPFNALCPTSFKLLWELLSWFLERKSADFSCVLSVETMLLFIVDEGYGFCTIFLAKDGVWVLEEWWGGYGVYVGARWKKWKVMKRYGQGDGLGYVKNVCTSDFCWKLWSVVPGGLFVHTRRTVWILHGFQT